MISDNAHKPVQARADAYKFVLDRGAAESLLKRRDLTGNLGQTRRPTATKSRNGRFASSIDPDCDCQTTRNEPR